MFLGLVSVAVGFVGVMLRVEAEGIVYHFPTRAHSRVCRRAFKPAFFSLVCERGLMTEASELFRNRKVVGRSGAFVPLGTGDGGVAWLCPAFR